MSKSWFTSIDVGGGSDSDGNSHEKSAQNEPSDGWGEFFRFQPIQFYDFHKRQIERLRSAKDKRDYYTNAARKLWAWATRSRTGILVSFASVVCFFGLVLLLPDAVVALFTVVLAAIAIVQWHTTNRQLEEARIASQQTDKIIEHMRSEQRAWLAVRRPEAKIDEAGAMAKIMIPVFNHGRTPGSLLRGGMQVLIDRMNGSEFGVFALAFIKLFETHPTLFVRSDDLPPDSSLVCHGDKTVSAEEMSEIQSGETLLFVIGRVRYRDVAGSERVTQQCFVWKPAAKEFWAYTTPYNQMD